MSSRCLTRLPDGQVRRHRAGAGRAAAVPARPLPAGLRAAARRRRVI